MTLRYGIELESAGLTGQEIKEAIESAGGVFGGIMSYHGTARGGYNDSRVQGEYVWTVESDSSIGYENPIFRRNGQSYRYNRMCSMTQKGTHEIVSPIMYGEAGLKHMARVMKALARAGAMVYSTCGTHVTISANNSRWNRMSLRKTAKVCRNINNFVVKYGNVIDMIVAPSRRGTRTGGRSPSGYCNRNQYWGEEYELSRPSMQRYSNINWGNFRLGNANRTLHAQARDTRLGNRMEFRQHQGTMNGAKLANWIRLNHKIISQFVNDNMSAGTDPMGQSADFGGFCVALDLGDELKQYMIDRMVKFGFMEVQ